MPGANNILPFAQGGGANVESQISYSGDSQRPLGNQPGNARSSFVNKVLRQCAAIAAGLGKFTADNQGADVDDSLVPSAMAALIEDALTAFAASHQASAQDLTSLSAGYVRFPGGFMLQWVRGVSDVNGELILALPQAFSSVLLGGIANEGEASGWLAGSGTVWGLDYAASSLTTVKAVMRNLTAGAVAGVPGITGTILAWGK